ncbi:MAG: tripartite tricarboxylate transporter permease, partial [Granulosicoccus sp.]|nr:tripartite tricarboxylate transporter permease [Granulosicoccus sp.]
MDAITALIEALTNLITPMSLFHVAWATLLGIFVGSLPGLTATMGVALLTTLTYTLERDAAILVLICMYVGAIYGGSRSAILLNIPGTPASAATSLDGYPLAKSGKANYAMTLATAGSALGTLVGIILLVLLAPPLAEVALNFGSFEFFWLAVFGIVISAQLTAGTSQLKGYIAGLLGLMVAMIGSEGIHAHVRFNLGFSDLNGGIALIPAMVGAFGFAEILTVMWRPRGTLIDSKTNDARTLPKFSDLWRYKFTIGRS